MKIPRSFLLATIGLCLSWLAITLLSNKNVLGCAVAQALSLLCCVRAVREAKKYRSFAVVVLSISILVFLFLILVGLA